MQNSMRPVQSCSYLAVVLTAMSLLGTAHAQDRIPGALDGRASPPMSSTLPDVQTGAVFGVVIDGETRQPISGATMRLREMGRGELSHGDGSFHFLNLAPGGYTLVAQRIGYAPVEKRVRVIGGDTIRVTMELTASAIEVAGIVVTGTGRERGVGETYQATSVVGGAELRRRLESSVAATVRHIPGISQQFNGPAASQPVIRGMGGDRVLVLEDGQRTGDLASTAADHAVAIEPLTAERIEVVRGPASLLYGSNALGGVINVIREEVPRSLPETFTGNVIAQGESVNRGFTGGAMGLLPVGRFALRGELSGRMAGDTHTPLGVLPSSDLRGTNGSVAASLITSWGFTGLALRDYVLDYGVPGQFAGELIPGAHPGGVEIEMRRRSARLEASHLTGIGPFNAVTFDLNVAHYQHDEIEGRIDDRTILGARFDNLYGGLNLLARHRHETEGLRVEGALGTWAHARDNRAVGGFTGSRSAQAFSMAGFGYEELAVGLWRFQLGGRYDWTRVVPLSLAPITINERVVPVRSRDFGALSGSVAAFREMVPGWTAGVSVARAFRTPSLEELYSDGPHLGDFSYDIGNPELKPEVGQGIEVLVRGSLPRLQLEVSAFGNFIRNYIFHRPTGEIDPRFFRFPVFEAGGEDARFIGAEGGAQWEPVRHLVLDGNVSWVHATLSTTGDPLPAIPPLNGGFRVRYDRPFGFLSAGVDGAAAQHRISPSIPDPRSPGQLLIPERPTSGYGLVNASGGLRWARGERFHTVTLSVDNLTNTTWRDHLSRIKDVAPQPGRNVRLLYSVQF
jgi:iron complex outermembrane recepter protein